MKSFLIKSAIASGVVLSLATLTRPAMASSFTVSIENAGVQNAQLSNLVSSNVNTFTGQTAGYSANGFTSTIGTYDNGLIKDANLYGGAGGAGQYFDVDTNNGSVKTVSTLTLKNAQSYFGLWWSAGDASNVLTFLSQGKVVQTITTADVVSYIAGLANKASYYGNPNSTFANQDSGEPFAFINFYDVAGTFDQVQFTNVGGTGFESDNHTVATSYNNITGNVVTKAVPESSSLLGVFVIGFVGATSVLTRRVNKKSVLQLS
ncbi:Npun_F0296 family exosortase-dependent surface protein [Nostoc sp.]|uniref:Npun_F0296 family exosortase-dependent surface protein n=1 Tax=Nostoc sp. TaxID=1180 RepID=UPI002FF5C345